MLSPVMPTGGQEHFVAWPGVVADDRPRLSLHRAPAEPGAWDYLLVTASNEDQAASYETQLGARREQGLLGEIGEVLVVPDPENRRIGSGGSTVLCLMEVLRRELADHPQALGDPAEWLATLRGLRILILHAGGDSRRLPAYGPCGKLFVPVPGADDLFSTLFDRQLPTYLALPATAPGEGQVVIASGDVLIDFDPSEVRFADVGITGLACLASPRISAKHGVYSLHDDGRVERFFQKPSVEQQAAEGMIDRYGRSALDIGVMGFDAATAVRLLKMVEATADAGGTLAWSGPMSAAIAAGGLDFYREIACALGRGATPTHHAAAARAGGSIWDDAGLSRVFESLRGSAFGVHMLSGCEFLHFGTTRQLLTSGAELVRGSRGLSEAGDCLSVNNEILPGGEILGRNAWVEGCRINSTLTLEGENVVVGADIDCPVSLSRGACLDVLPGRNHAGEEVFFVRCYGIDDTFKDGFVGHVSNVPNTVGHVSNVPNTVGHVSNVPGTMESCPTYCGGPFEAWLEAMGATAADVWDQQIPPPQRDLFHARIIPAESHPADFHRWLWLFDPAEASEAQKKAWLSAPRYSFAEMVALTDKEAFHGRRARFRADAFRHATHRLFSRDSDLSAVELAYLLRHADDPAAWVAELLVELHRRCEGESAAGGLESLVPARMMHTLGSAVLRLASDENATLEDVVGGLGRMIPVDTAAWLKELGLRPRPDTTVGRWTQRAKSSAFELMGRAIVGSDTRQFSTPYNSLRSDEIVWGRAPARLDLCGGWTDTPPYSLEFGGCVLNVAVNLNNQSPIQTFARVIDEPVIRIASIDRGTRIEISRFEELLDYREVKSEFSLTKAALVLSGFSPPDDGDGPPKTLRDMLEAFGGGLELTTLSAIPKGSGLGTSSIMGAVVLAVINRVLGRDLSRRELFHQVLRLEQAMTTGGGWQDQVGGVVDGLKLITTEPGMVPDAVVEFVPGDVLRPADQGGQTLLYYTGITRLAKNILGQVVGRHLDRDRTAMATLSELRALAPQVSAAMARRDLPAFGCLIDEVWQLNKRLDPGSTNEEIESLLDRVRPHIYGAKLLGAGGGGFLLLVCKSPEAAREVREELEANPPNDRARFFQFDVNQEGLQVTTC